MQALKRWCSDTITTPLKYDIDEGRSFPERIGRIPESERTGRRRMLLQAHNTMTTAYDSMADLLRTGTFPEENARLRLVGDDVNARQGVLGLLAEVVKAQNLADGFATLKPEWDAVFMSTARAMLTSRPPSMDSFSPSNFLAHAVAIDNDHRHSLSRQQRGEPFSLLPAAIANLAGFGLHEGNQQIPQHIKQQIQRIDELVRHATNGTAGSWHELMQQDADKETSKDEYELHQEALLEDIHQLEHTYKASPALVDEQLAPLGLTAKEVLFYLHSSALSIISNMEEQYGRKPLHNPASGGAGSTETTAAEAVEIYHIREMARLWPDRPLGAWRLGGLHGNESLGDWKFDQAYAIHSAALQQAVADDDEIYAAIFAWHTADWMLQGGAGPSFPKADVDRLLEQARHHDKVCHKYGAKERIHALHVCTSNVVMVYGMLTKSPYMISDWVQALPRATLVDMRRNSRPAPGGWRPNVPELIMNQCAKCGAQPLGIRTCSRCKQVCYCSKACQKGDWTKHKKECAPTG